MTGRGNPPEGSPSGASDDDELRATVFDETFVRDARLQEFSARERLEDHRETPVRPLPESAVRRLPTTRRPTGQGLLLMLLIVLAFGAAIWMGVSTPYQEPVVRPAEPLRAAVVPLAPRGAVPGSDPADLFENSPAARFDIGAEGIVLPAAERTTRFSPEQVLAALTMAKTYVVESSLSPQVLTGGAEEPVRALLTPAQHQQFDRSMRSPAADGRHLATGWLVRFDAARVELADPGVRVRGTLHVVQSGEDALEVTADHVLVYALRPADAPPGQEASLFTVRRELRMHFDRADLRERRLSVEHSLTQAGPLPCGGAVHDRLRPLLAGEDADRASETDPYAQGRGSAALCGVLAPSAQPVLPG
ncbi:hypothetical protein QNO07_13270 [Streptomyces sp. 549]|uniref:SCO2583 family membrane protein n=1 Tax=Streptomyces sp. 549 TaxID=3049076 RepID=UPI0024C27607|nr:hypothetical protein [Streptomyces sp. 549]MDK1474379.1 hypothetical protein [Streptomyces sp. 549]